MLKDEEDVLELVGELPEGVSPYGTLTLKFAASGVATTSAKFVTGKNATGKDIVYSASCSSVLIPNSKLFTFFLYFPPKAGKFDGYAAEVALVWDGKAFGLQ